MADDDLGVTGGPSVLDKVRRERKLVVGARDGAPPFGFYDESGQWVGWSIDLSKALHGAIETKLGLGIDLEFKAVSPQTRIPLIVNGTLDWVLGTTGRTPEREEVIDFSHQTNVSCVMTLVSKSSPIARQTDLSGQRIGVTRGSVEERFLTDMGLSGELTPPPILITHDTHSVGFLSLSQGKTDAHVTLETTLRSLKAKTQNPDDWEVRGPELFCIPNGVLLPEDDSDWKDMVDNALCHVIASGVYDEIYDEWFGPTSPKAGFSRPLPEAVRIVLENQCPFGIERWLDGNG